jgi:hypothetical protein
MLVILVDVASQVAVFESIAIAFEGDHVGVAGRAGRSWRRRPRRRTPHPSAERLVAGDDRAGPFVAGGDQLKEQVGCFGLERDVSNLVDDHQWVTSEPRQLACNRPAWWVTASRSTHWLAAANRARCPAWQARIASPVAKSVFPLPGWMARDRNIFGRCCRAGCVTAWTHPLFGELLAGSGFRRWNGVPLLVVELPDGSPVNRHGFCAVLMWAAPAV